MASHHKSTITFIKVQLFPFITSKDSFYKFIIDSLWPSSIWISSKYIMHNDPVFIMCNSSILRVSTLSHFRPQIQDVLSGHYITKDIRNYQGGELYYLVYKYTNTDTKTMGFKIFYAPESLTIFAVALKIIRLTLLLEIIDIIITIIKGAQ